LPLLPVQQCFVAERQVELEMGSHPCTAEQQQKKEQKLEKVVLF
jgi:hypothetical protein